jgi:hypothetical protein
VASRSTFARCVAIAVVGGAVLPARAQIESGGKTLDGSRALLLAVDADDDDMDGLPDMVQSEAIPTEDLVEIVIDLAGGDVVQVTTLGGVRLVRNGNVVTTPVVIPSDDLPEALYLQATQPSLGGRPAAVLVTQGPQTVRIPIHAVQISLLDGHGEPLDPALDALSVSHRVTNDDSLPRGNRYDARSADTDNVRVQILDSAAQGMRATARVVALDHRRGQVRSDLAVELRRPTAGFAFRPPFLRLVGDEVDRGARGVAGQVLQVALRDHVRVVYSAGDSTVHQNLRVGRPGDERGPLAARQAVLRAVVMRSYPGGPPVIGTDDMSALRIVREEVAIANEIWLQCHITFGAPSEVSISIEDPPGPWLLSVSDGDGLPARGGTIHLRADGLAFGPIPTMPGATPQDTALRIARAVQKGGLFPTVTVNPATVYGAGESADVVVRRGDGRFAQIEAIEGVPLTTDLQQRVVVGSVDLGDGLEEFDNMTATGGTLEERTLIKTLGDDDPSTVELFIINRFKHGTRQGEAFIAASAGPILDVVVLDRNGLRQRQTAWTMAHELGHVLLDQPLHPDNVGPDIPSLLMDADNSRGTVHGPKRLLPGDCKRARHESETRADPPLLRPYDPRPLR